MRIPKVLILILNWNGKTDTLECLASLNKLSQSPRFSILIVDNGSTDDSVVTIRNSYPDIPILETKANLGFAGGNNAGLRWALTKNFEWIFLLNNDTVVAPDCIHQLMQAAKEKPLAKILGAKIFRYYELNRLDHLGGLWNPKRAEFISIGSDQMDDGSFEEMQPVDYVCGAALLMHRTVLEKIGFLEEKFFLLWEESDFCTRAKKADFEIWTAPQAKIWHKVSASFTGGKPHMHYFWWRNRLLFINRNCTRREKWSLYYHLIGQEILKCFKLAIIKTIEIHLRQLFRLKIEEDRSNKAKRYRAGSRGILHYFLGRFGNCPSVYGKKS